MIVTTIEMSNPALQKRKSAQATTTILIGNAPQYKQKGVCTNIHIGVFKTVK
jgi:hypothetical protein